MIKLFAKLLKKPAIWAVAVAVVAVVVAGLAIDRAETLSAENVRLTTNQTALLSDIETYKTEAGDNAASIYALTLERNEYRRLCSRQAADINALGLKLRDVESYASMVAATTVEVETVIRDTVYIQGDTTRIFHWSDAWVNISGRLTDNSVACEVRSIDTLDQVVHRVPRKFLFLRYGTKAIKQEIVSRNPHTVITHAEYIRLMD